MWIFSQRSKRCSRGFTLIEMLVVMTIMIVITIVFLVRQSRFNSSTVLRSLAYSVALSVRQAQVYGTSVIGTTTSAASCSGGFYSATNGSCYAAAYGIYMAGAGSMTTYTLFADLNNNGAYDSNEVVKTFNLSTGYVISNYCVLGINSGVATCAALTCPAAIPGFTYSSCTPNALVNATVLFRRPNPDACFDDNGGGFCAAGASPVNQAMYIQLQSTADPANAKGVTVSTTGEISVCTNTSC